MSERTRRDSLPRVGCSKFGGAIALIAGTLVLSGCVESEKPLVTDSQPLLGAQFEVHLYENFREGKAGDFNVSTYGWDGGKYVRSSGLMRDATSFVVRELNGNDFIVEGSNGVDKVFNYWIGRRVIYGVYLIFPINESDVDPTIRNEACAKGKPEEVCRINTYDHLVTLALATAGKPVRTPALGVIVPKPPITDK
jgi:hypothetical protein